MRNIFIETYKGITVTETYHFSSVIFLKMFTRLPQCDSKTSTPK